MVSKSAAISRKRNIAKYSFSVVYVLFGLYFLAFERAIMGTLFLALGIAWLFFYPKLNRKSLERYYAKYTQENFAGQMNRNTEMKILNDCILIRDGIVENSVSEFEKAIETVNHFFLREKSGNTFIVPKNQIDSEQFITVISGLPIPVENETKWRWK